ncbi:hypothetical protein GCM10010512_17980 [Streptomyces thermoviolaceus subsp. thermoviolaceus]|nr:hypothetical protein GCM10010499_20350 [Streptomyces thermoviolaceus subsp. apingens]GHA86853.1 hypothetical protein GCM10010512_17980 [Streptomyces thermoviolaceus subsp. thermoviolaceus]
MRNVAYTWRFPKVGEPAAPGAAVACAPLTRTEPADGDATAPPGRAKPVHRFNDGVSPAGTHHLGAEDAWQGQAQCVTTVAGTQVMLLLGLEPSPSAPSSPGVPWDSVAWHA